MALHGHTGAPTAALSTGPQFPTEEQALGLPAPPLDDSQQLPAGGLTDFSPGDELEFGQAFSTSRQQGAQFFMWRGNLYHTRTADEEANTRELITTQGDVQRQEDLANVPLPETALSHDPTGSERISQDPVNAPIGAGGPDLAALAGQAIQGAQASAPAPGGEIGADFGAMQGIGDAGAQAGPGALQELQNLAGSIGEGFQGIGSGIANQVSQDFQGDNSLSLLASQAGGAVKQFRDETVRPALGLGDFDEARAEDSRVRQGRRDELGSVLGELDTSASQLFMGNTEPGRALLGRGVSNLKEQVGEDINSLKSLGGEAVDAATQLVSTLPENFKETLEVVEALLTLDENNPLIPESFRKVQKEFMKAANIAVNMPGGSKARASDDFRHFEGARNAAREAGILPTLVASTAHELKNIVNVLFGTIKNQTDVGDKTGLDRVLAVVKESGRDVKNNLRGITTELISRGMGPRK